MQTVRHLLAAFLAFAAILLLAACDMPDSSDPAGPAYSVCRPPEPGTNYQVCG
ncbi:hypothetical protein [Paracoccus binzhouensis]|uniref:hypothetical protein n=1 Tax=Paracoccus binzhouensis TaxID=2796149 RepID=UPI0018EF27F6|nr:hypothetical protein [Paracoccus binzhouensis]